MKLNAKIVLTVFMLFAFQKSKADISPYLKCLWLAYPSFKISSDGQEIFFKDGSRMPFTDHSGLDPIKDFDRIIDNVTSLEQMFLVPYKKGFLKDSRGHIIVVPPAENQDPGRFRYEAFFKKIYGKDQAETKARQIQVLWEIDGSKWLFNKNFFAAAAFAKVSADLSELVKQRPDLKPFLISPLGGTYAWRNIAGSNNLSFHSFGVAIDINTKKTDYWRWDASKEKSHLPKFRNRIPPEIAQVFEAHGFIWGGKWSHYDTMHFEYRPELMMDPAYCEQRFLEEYKSSF